MHPDVKDEFDELARALEGVKEDFVHGVKVIYPELQGENGTEHQSDKGHRGEDYVFELLIVCFP